MLDGLAIWALFIYLLRWAGMPWNKYTKGMAYLGGASWLMFVWVGLLNYAPMDMSGGSLVQSPHVQLRPDSANVTGKLTAIHIEPNQRVTKGQLVYEIDDTPFKIAVNQAQTNVDATRVAVEQAEQDLAIASANHSVLNSKLTTALAQIKGAEVDVTLQSNMLKRLQEQNRVSSHSVTQSDLDNQMSKTEIAKLTFSAFEAEKTALESEIIKSILNIDKAASTIEARLADLRRNEEVLSKAQWELNSTKVTAPADGFVTNFILREGQRVSLLPRLQMFTDEKYVLMRVNHQAIRNISKGSKAEFSSSVYPGKIFAAEVEGIVEATGEAQSTLTGWEVNVQNTANKNLYNKTHFVRLKIDEPEGYDIPVGSVGHAWVSGKKPIGFMSFLDMLRGIIIRMNSQLYYFYSV